MAGDYGDYKEHTKYCNCIRYASSRDTPLPCSLDHCVVGFPTHEITDGILNHLRNIRIARTSFASDMAESHLRTFQ